MRDLRRSLVALLALAASACGTATMAPSATLTTTTPGVTERFFRIEWAVADAGGHRTIDGHIANVSGRPASRVQLLVQALDSAGNVVHQQRQWIGGVVPNGATQYFHVASVPAADRYQVNIWSFDIIEAGGRDL